MSAREPRYEAFAKVQCQKYGSGTLTLMVLRNVSKTGARLNLVATTMNFSKGDVLRLVFDLEAVKRRRIVSAEIRWTHANTMGVSFISPDQVYTKLMGRSSV